MIEAPCPLCDAPAAVSHEVVERDPAFGVDESWQKVQCPDCGKFTIEASTWPDLPDPDHRRCVLAYALRRIPPSQPRPVLDRATMDMILAATQLPRPHELPDAVVDYLGRKTNPGQVEVLEFQRLRSAIGTSTSQAAQWAVFAARDLGIFGKDSSFTMSGSKVQVALSAHGWERFAELQRRRPDSKQAFWASKYGVPELDGLVNDFLRPAVKATGFDLVRLDDEPRAGLIDDRLRVEIRRSRILIADLTHTNPGAYWESGFAEGLGLPVIYTCRKKEWDDPKTKPHFDTNHFTTVIWDPADPQAAADQLKVVIRATLPTEAVLTDVD
jgi:hypothetical protein